MIKYTMPSIAMVLSFFFLLSRSYGDEGHQAEEGGAQGRVGVGRAVTEFNKDEGFKLSEDTLRTFKIQFQKLASRSQWTLPVESLVRLKHSTAVYRRYEGWISLVLVKTVSQKDGEVVVQSEDLQEGDDVAVSGVMFLRMTDLDLNAETVDSCSH